MAGMPNVTVVDTNKDPDIIPLAVQMEGKPGQLLRLDQVCAGSNQFLPQPLKSYRTAWDSPKMSHVVSAQSRCVKLLTLA